MQPYAESGAGRPAAARKESAAELAAFLLPFLLYAATLAPTVTLEDSGEFITAAYHLGVPHPSGYPLWCLAAHAFTWLPWGTVAERVHLSSAFFAAATTWLLYRVSRRLFGDWRAALVASLGLGASRTLWSQSVIAEVYALNALLTIVLVDLALRWRETRALRWLFALAFAVGVGLTNHPLLVLAALPIFLWLLVIDARALFRPRVIATGGAVLLLGLSVYLYLPIRAAADPPLNVGNPRTAQATIAHVRRDVYFTRTEVGRTAGGVRDVALHTADAWLDTGRSLGWPLALVALLGVVTWPRGTRDVLAVSLAIAFCNTLVLNGMLTAPHVPLWVYAHRVYYIPTHVMAALWIASGAALLLRMAARRSAAHGHVMTAMLALSVVFAAVRSYPEAHQTDNQIARNLALDLLDSAPPSSGFLPVGDEVLYPVLYARHVEGLRPDVHLLSSWYGWRKEPYAMLLSGDPLNDQLREDLPGLHDYVSVPRGIVHALVPRSAAPAESYATFVPLPRPPRDAGLEHARPDVFIDAVRARYATYHARLGALLLSRGERAEALAELDRAELLDPGDAHVEVLLARVYRDFQLRTERARPLLEAALRNHERTFDPHTSRYDVLRREDIERELAR